MSEEVTSAARPPLDDLLAKAIDLAHDIPSIGRGRPNLGVVAMCRELLAILGEIAELLGIEIDES